MKRQFIGILIFMFFSTFSCTNKKTMELTELNLDTTAIIKKADQYLNIKPITITDFVATRSAGGIHDYYSEGSYWWPNPADPEGPFIRKDGQRNPNNFTAHKKVLKKFSSIVTTLIAAYKISNDEKYAAQAIEHLKAWFVDPNTRMNPNLRYAQAIKGINTGRGIGIIDTIRLINVAIGIEALENDKYLKGETLIETKKWFSDFSDWLTTHPYGIDERDNNNNHSTWWGAQVAAYASVAGRKDLLVLCQNQFKKQLELQMVADGSFPDELARTRPFHYMNYNLRAWTTFAQLASTKKENLWNYKSEQGTLQKAIDFAIPFYKNPKSWKYSTAIEKEIYPHKNDFLVLAYMGLKEKKYLKLWMDLDGKEKDNIIGDANLILWNNQCSL